eukprot:TRINITY_DN22309_c0_g1_i2.p1 TRINITY_DN22309_c0_g1~~TRINITY_DN22309_c0_g1_i2.p1  ORF type:complete len:792 (-),score=130.29 TRINITY_DN22309_c0_g1_i2:259-2634(-)
MAAVDGAPLEMATGEVLLSRLSSEAQAGDRALMAQVAKLEAENASLRSRMAHMETVAAQKAEDGVRLHEVLEGRGHLTEKQLTAIGEALLAKEGDLASPLDKLERLKMGGCLQEASLGHPQKATGKPVLLESGRQSQDLEGFGTAETARTQLEGLSSTQTAGADAAAGEAIQPPDEDPEDFHAESRVASLKVACLAENQGRPCDLEGLGTAASAASGCTDVTDFSQRTEQTMPPSRGSRMRMMPWPNEQQQYLVQLVEGTLHTPFGSGSASSSSAGPAANLSPAGAFRKGLLPRSPQSALRSTLLQRPPATVSVGPTPGHTAPSASVSLAAVAASAAAAAAGPTTSPTPSPGGQAPLSSRVAVPLGGSSPRHFQWPVAHHHGLQLSHAAATSSRGAVQPTSQATRGTRKSLPTETQMAQMQRRAVLLAASPNPGQGCPSPPLTTRTADRADWPLSPPSSSAVPVGPGSTCQARRNMTQPQAAAAVATAVAGAVVTLATPSAQQASRVPTPVAPSPRRMRSGYGGQAAASAVSAGMSPSRAVSAAVFHATPNPLVAAPRPPPQQMGGAPAPSFSLPTASCQGSAVQPPGVPAGVASVGAPLPTAVGPLLPPKPSAAPAPTASPSKVAALASVATVMEGGMATGPAPLADVSVQQQQQPFLAFGSSRAMRSASLGRVLPGPLPNGSGAAAAGATALASVVGFPSNANATPLPPSGLFSARSFSSAVGPPVGTAPPAANGAPQVFLAHHAPSLAQPAGPGGIRPGVSPMVSRLVSVPTSCTPSPSRRLRDGTRV